MLFRCINREGGEESNKEDNCCGYFCLGVVIVVELVELFDYWASDYWSEGEIAGIVGDCEEVGGIVTNKKGWM